MELIPHAIWATVCLIVTLGAIIYLDRKEISSQLANKVREEMLKLNRQAEKALSSEMKVIRKDQADILQKIKDNAVNIEDCTTSLSMRRPEV